MSTKLYIERMCGVNSNTDEPDFYVSSESPKVYKVELVGDVFTTESWQEVSQGILDAMLIMDANEDDNDQTV